MIFENKKVYNISFKKRIEGLNVEGNMYINADSYAVQRFNYEIYGLKKNHKRKKDPLDKNRSKELVFETKLEYVLENGFMYLNYHSMNNSFQVIQPPKFKIEKALVNFNKKCFIMKFNNDLEEKGALRKSNYKVFFNGGRVKFKKLVLIGDEVLLFPDLENEENLFLFNEIKTVAEKGSFDGELLEVYVKDLKDIDGNEIHKDSYSSGRQFREFFVQQLQTKNIEIPDKTFLMKKNIPIFKYQPIGKPANFGDYWMNTPLQKPVN